MGSQKDASLAIFHLPMHNVVAVNCHIEPLELSPEQKNPVQNRSRKIMQMLKDTPPMRRRTEHAPQVFVGCAPRFVCRDHEVERDRVEKQARAWPADVQCDPDKYTCQPGAPALRHVRPTLRRQ